MLSLTSVLWLTACTAYQHSTAKHQTGKQIVRYTPSTSSGLSISVSHCALQEGMVGNYTTPAFFIVHKQGQAPLSLVGVRIASLTSQTQLRVSNVEYGVTGERVIQAQPLMEGDNWFRKGRFYAVLMNIKRPLELGEMHMMKLTFNDGQTQSCNATVRSFDDLTPRKRTYIYTNGMPYQYTDKATFVD